MSKKPPTYFISAGEYSGDLLAAELCLAIAQKEPNMHAFGLVGPAMERAGIEKVYGIESFAVMGISEVAKRLGDLKMLESNLLQKIDEQRPEFAVLVDFPGLHLRLAEQLRLRGIPVIQYVAPKVWAWGRGRVRSMARDFDLVLGILPFEESFFKENGVNYRYIGSPQKDRTDAVVVQRSSFGLSNEQVVFALLPGSRPSEIEAILPKIEKIKAKLEERFNDAVFLIPVAESLPSGWRRRIKAVLNADGKRVRVLPGCSLEAMAIADVAVVASGTATLECGLLNTPMVVIYAMNSFTYEMAKDKVKVPHMSLVNLIAEEEIVEEYIQDFSIDRVVKSVCELVENEEHRDRMLERLDKVSSTLVGRASDRASHELLSYLDKHITL